MPKNYSPKPTVALEKQLKFILKHLKNPHKIGKESPLAAPYFLGQSSTGSTTLLTAQGRGEALITKVRNAAKMLWHGPLPRNHEELYAAIPEIRLDPAGDRYAYVVLELRCFQDYIRLRRMSDIWDDEKCLPASRAEHYRDFDRAVSRLGEMLWHQLHPGFRPEQPVAPRTFFGYQVHYQQALTALEAKQTVTIYGPGGVGKTTLGAALASKWPNQSVFWFTIRPMINERLNSILFSLGHFLHQQGTSHLWQLIVSEGGVILDIHLATGLLQEDLETLAGYPPLFCFDELDRLQLADSSASNPAHQQILEFLEGLRGQIPLLLIGQRPILESDLQQQLTGLAVPQIIEWFQQQNLTMEPTDIEALYRYTGGNPRLLVLCGALLKQYESVAHLLAELPETPAIYPLLQRLWTRLEPDEQYLLQQLAVYRRPVPETIWDNDISSLDSLLQRRLVERDGYGGVSIRPAFRDAIYVQLLGDLRRQLHLEAAAVRLNHFEYTAVAYHFLQGQEETLAIQAWYPHRQQEIQSGQIDAAYALFFDIMTHKLTQSTRKALEVIRAELHQYRGEIEEGLERLDGSDWSKPQQLNILANHLRAEFQEALGYPDRALKTSGEGIEIAASLLNQLIDFRYQRSQLHIRQREIPLAWHEAQLAEYELQTLYGMLYEETGSYTNAQNAYEQSLTIAKGLNERRCMARAEQNLANLFGRIQQAVKAVEHASEAITLFEQIGDRLSAERVRSDLTFIYVQTKQFERAIEVGRKSYPFFKALKDPHRLSAICHNLSEAYLENGDLANAQKYASEILDHEERAIYPYALFTLGRINHMQNVFENAATHFVESARMSRMNEDPYMEAYAQRELGKVHLDQKNITAGAEALTQALQLFEQLGIDDEITVTRQLLQRQTDAM